MANKVKAGYLFNFAKFVEWPRECFQTKDSPIIVAVLGKDSIAEDIQATLQGTAIDGHPLEVRLVPETTEALDCHLLFICASERKRLPKIFEIQRGKHILTVSDMEHFNEDGGMICLRKEGVNIRFEINQKDAEKAGLKISSKLLQLAKPGR
ncbi:MAG: YfiR family protein [Verrucomicrobiales bacterium]|nr:YfiR family protein [Verrucomicrobiales bacterium]